MTTPDQDTTAQRSATRAPVGKPIKLQFDDSMDVVEGLCENISIGGMFIQVANTRPQGSLVRFELQLDDSTAVRGLGEVVWMRAKSAGAGRPAGIGIKFRFLEQRDRQLIFKLVSQHIKERLASRQAQGGPGSREPAPAAAPATPAVPPEPATPNLPPEPATPPRAPAEPVAPAALPPAPAAPAASPPPPASSLEVPQELLAVEAEPANLREVPREPSFPEPSLPEPPVLEPSVPESSVPGPPIRQPEIAAAEVLDSDDSEIPELLLIPEEEEVPEVELVEDFDAELEGLESAPALAESLPDLPRSESRDEETLSELTLTPGVEEEISYDEMMGRDVSGSGAPDFGVPDIGVPDTGGWDPDLPDPGMPDHGVPDTGVPDRGLPDAGEWETVGGAAAPLAGEGLEGEDFGPPRRRSPWLLALVAVLAAAAVAAYFFRDQFLGGKPAPASRTAEVTPAGMPDGPPSSEPTAESTAGSLEASGLTPEPMAEAPAPAVEEPATDPPAAAPPPSAPPVAVAPPPPAAPAAAEPPAASFTRVNDITWGPLAGGQRVVIATDGSVPQGRYKYSRLASPPRELIRLSGVRQPFAKTALAVGGPAVERIRLGYHPGNELHIVLDLADPRARIREVRGVGSTLEVDLEIP